MSTNKLNNGTTTRPAASPLMPTLAAHCRSTRSPHTPRLAASVTPTSTPAPRRHVYNDSPKISTPRGGSKEELATPVKAFLSSNITPRSSSRSSRASSVYSTPAGTPNGTPTNPRPATTIGTPTGRDRLKCELSTSVDDDVAVVSRRKSRSLIDGTGEEHNTPSGRPGLAGSLKLATDINRREGPVFFHANDAPPRETSPKMLSQTKSPTFFYADGQQERLVRDETSVPSPPLSAVGKESSTGKFFYADGTAENTANDPDPSTPSMTSSPNSSIITSPSQHLAPVRSPSPVKENIHLSYRKGISQVMRPAGHRLSHVSTVPASTPTGDRRRSSLEFPTGPVGHYKTASLSSIDSLTPPRKPFQKPIDIIIPPSTSLHSPTSRSVEFAKSPPSGHPSDPTSMSHDQPSSSSDMMLRSPTRSGFNPQNELATNARRERKVLDLEISNSSLLAINRQLEREVRKQKVELRRFRRLSRAGRLSTMTDRTSSAGVDDDGNPVRLFDLVEGTGDEEEEDAEEEEDYSDEMSVDDEELSPRSLRIRDARHRARDEKRLQLDLSKHRELLVDSQKLNQGLRRCLGWTEELIREGRKALEYRVRVSDVRLGGRVLDHDEREDSHASLEAHEHAGEAGLLGAWDPSGPAEPEPPDLPLPVDVDSMMNGITASLEDIVAISTSRPSIVREETV